MSIKEECVYWDACVFSSYHGAIPDRAPVLDAILAEVEKDRNRLILTSNISILEVAFGNGHGRGRPVTPEHAERIDALWRARHIKLVEIHRELLVEARDLMRRTVAEGLSGLTPNDALHLATAVWFDRNIGSVTEIHTYDGFWIDKMRTVVDLEICQPHANQPRLIG